MPEQPEDKYVTIRGRRFHYLDWNSGRKRTMVLLHGIGDNAHIWDRFAREAGRYVRIIALDQRGHGRSDWSRPPAYTCGDYVADLEGLMDVLLLKKAILLGHSMGALHATRYAALRPERVAALIHVDIEACPPEWNKKYLLNLYDQLPESYDSLGDYVSDARKNSPYADEALLLEIASRSLDPGKNGKLYHQFDREVLFHFDRYDLRPFLKLIRCPALAVRGEESRVMGESAAREMSGEIPGGALRRRPEGGPSRAYGQPASL